MPEGIENPRAVIIDFIAAWNKMDFNAVIAAFDDDIVYHNIPLTELRGIRAVHEYLQAAWRFEEVDWQLLNVAVNGEVVLTERIDNFIVNGQTVSLPVMGCFEVAGGKIRAWRDYFDLSEYRAQLRDAGLSGQSDNDGE